MNLEKEKEKQRKKKSEGKKKGIKKKKKEILKVFDLIQRKSLDGLSFSFCFVSFFPPPLISLVYIFYKYTLKIQIKRKINI